GVMGQFVADEHLQPLTADDVGRFLDAYAANKNRVLSRTDHAQILLKITDGTTGSFDAAKMKSVMEATKLVIQNRLIERVP
ncbi:MAG: hypothetical protein CFE26_07535, partial [Verrucomicrobiales bacterium VVV1]